MLRTPLIASNATLLFKAALYCLRCLLIGPPLGRRFYTLFTCPVFGEWLSLLLRWFWLSGQFVGENDGQICLEVWTNLSFGRVDDNSRHREICCIMYTSNAAWPLFGPR